MTPRRRLTVLLLAAMAGFAAALVVPRPRWRNRAVELASGPWPPLEPTPDAPG